MPPTSASASTPEEGLVTLASLSEALRSVWAKSSWDPFDPDHCTGWLPLTQHALDTLHVAELLWDEWTPPALRYLLAAPLGGDLEATRAVFLFLAGGHDVGKGSPAFTVQVPVLTGAMAEAGLRISAGIAGTEERRLARHELVGYLAIEEWLSSGLGLSQSAARQLASVVGIHHGTAVRRDLFPVARRTALCGDGAWARVRVELLEWMAELSGLNRHVSALHSASFGAHRLVLLSALVVIADWIASDADHFPLFPLGAPQPAGRRRAAKAWAALGLPPQWSAVSPGEDIDDVFRRRFGFGPRPVQAEFARAASQLTEPALLILEAPMGYGKTEAALVAAEIRAAATGASGLFIGLPTQATADGMFSRARRWAGHLPGNAPTIFLAHGKREQNEEFDALLRAAHLVSIAQDDAEAHDPSQPQRAHDAIAHAWLSDRRRGPLAGLVIGTIDQALMASLRSRYAQLRHLALANKVVVIDEAHAYSTFMNVYLDRTLHWLGAYGTTAIILSATLPARRRQELVAAYESGRREARGERPRRGTETLEEELAPLAGDVGYPAIVVSRSVGAPIVLAVDGGEPGTTVELRRIPDSAEAVADELTSLLRDGGCAAVVRNTVDRAQRTADELRRRFPDDLVILAHANFLVADRAAKNRRLLCLFGPPGGEGVKRPYRAIVVGTQVIEQSLDIDFDVIVSDLAPIDLLLQRSGRLHRHCRLERPAPVSTPRLIVTGVEWRTTPPRPNPAYRSIYHPYLLLRTLHVLRDRSTLVLPDDIAPLVQTVYGEEAVPEPEWRVPIDEARRQHEDQQRERRRLARSFQLNTVAAEPDLVQWNTSGADDPDAHAKGATAVRDGGDSIEVLAVWNDGGTHVLPPWLDEHGGAILPDLEPPSPRLTRALLSCSLRLPYRLCVPETIDAHIEELERRHPAPAWRRSPALKRELVLVFDRNGRSSLGRHRLRYTRENGLEVMADE